MGQLAISDAMEHLEELYKALQCAYWDASEIYQKDTVFDIVSVINSELSELNKLSIEDYTMTYEPVSAEFRQCANKLKKLHTHIAEWFPRTKTANDLAYAVNNTLQLLSFPIATQSD